MDADASPPVAWMRYELFDVSLCIGLKCCYENFDGVS